MPTHRYTQELGRREGLARVSRSWVMIDHNRGTKKYSRDALSRLFITLTNAYVLARSATSSDSLYPRDRGRGQPAGPLDCTVLRCMPRICSGDGSCGHGPSGLDANRGHGFYCGRAREPVDRQLLSRFDDVSTVQRYR